MAVRALQRFEVEAYKAIRLRALRADPAAFASTFEREAAFDEATWRNRLTSFAGRPGAVFVDDIDGDLQAMLGVGHTAINCQAVIWGMWADPAVRRRGSARRLLVAAFDWCDGQGLTSLTLCVFPTSSSALALYRSVGFTETSSNEAESDETTTEITMYRPVQTASRFSTYPLRNSNRVMQIAILNAWHN